MHTSPATESNDLLIVSAPSAVPALSEVVVTNELDDMAGTDTVVETGHAWTTSLRTSEYGNDRGGSFVELATLQAVTTDIISPTGTDTVIEVDPIVFEPGRHKEERAGGLKADSNEVAVESLTDISLEPAGFESVTRPHVDGVMLLHGDFSSLVDSEPAVAAATEELFGNYNFIRIEPTTSDVGQESRSKVSYEIGDASDSLVEMPLLHGDTRSPADTHAAGTNTEQLLGAYNFVVAEPTAPEFIADAALIGNTRGTSVGMADISDGTSNTILFATNNVLSDLGVKYTLSGAEGDDLLPGSDVLDVGDLLTGTESLADGFFTDVERTSTPDGSAAIQLHGGGQANGIIAVLIGVSTDPQGSLANGSPVLD